MFKDHQDKHVSQTTWCWVEWSCRAGEQGRAWPGPGVAREEEALILAP